VCNLWMENWSCLDQGSEGGEYEIDALGQPTRQDCRFSTSRMKFADGIARSAAGEKPWLFTKVITHSLRGIMLASSKDTNSYPR
jgi:hypothetical protein